MSLKWVLELYGVTVASGITEQSVMDTTKTDAAVGMLFKCAEERPT